MLGRDMLIAEEDGASLPVRRGNPAAWEAAEDDGQQLRARDFDRLDDGRYICAEFSSGLWIRCIAHHDGWFEHADGVDEIHRYRLVPLPMVPE